MKWIVILFLQVAVVYCSEDDETKFLSGLILKKDEHVEALAFTKHLILNEANGTLYPETLSQLKNLEILTIQFSNFDEIKPGSLCQSPKLKTISISAHLHQELSEEHFEGCKNLETLEIKYNTFAIGQNAFRKLENLETLTTEQFKWGSLKKGDFTGLKGVKKISITDGDVDKVEPGTFEGLDNLEELILTNNKFVTVNGDEFRGLSHLKFLNIDFNPTETLNVTELLKNLPNLKSAQIPYYYYHHQSEDVKKDIKEKFENVGISDFYTM